MRFWVGYVIIYISLAILIITNATSHVKFRHKGKHQKIKKVKFRRSVDDNLNSEEIINLMDEAQKLNAQNVAGHVNGFQLLAEHALTVAKHLPTQLSKLLRKTATELGRVSSLPVSASKKLIISFLRTYRVIMALPELLVMLGSDIYDPFRLQPMVINPRDPPPGLLPLDKDDGVDH